MDEEKNQFISSMNSYLGMMKHYKTYKLRKQMIKNRLLAGWWNSVFIKRDYEKFVLRNKPRTYQPYYAGWSLAENGELENDTKNFSLV